MIENILTAILTAGVIVPIILFFIKQGLASMATKADIAHMQGEIMVEMEKSLTQTSDRLEGQLKEHSQRLSALEARNQLGVIPPNLERSK